MLSPEQAIAVALWTVYTWLHKREAFATHSALVHVWGAEAESGKSTLASVVRWLVCSPLMLVEPTPAVLFRAIQKWSPTIILDEADNILTKSTELRSIINGGWTRGEQVLRCAPKTFEPEMFELFAPKMVVMKGRSLPGTTASRTICIEMKPKLATEACEDFDHLDSAEFRRLRKGISEWASDNAEALVAVKAAVVMPAGFTNRRRANWLPLIAIAEQMGCAEAARAAASAIEMGDRLMPDERSVGLELLADMRDVFDQVTRRDRVETDIMHWHLNSDGSRRNGRRPTARLGR